MKVSEAGLASFPDLDPIFVVGASRSGTTLLQLILNAHPDVAIHGEIHFFNAVLQLKREIPDLLSSGRLAQFFDQLKRPSSFQYLPGIEARLLSVRQRLEQANSPSYEMFFRLLLEVYAEDNQAVRCGEKTPENIRYLHDLVTVFPMARIIHIVRDPRDVVASLMRMPWAPNSVVINALKWKVDMLYVQDFLRSGGTIHELRYEDLVTTPETQLRSLCRFINVPWKPAMLEFNRTAGINIRDEPWKNGTRSKINTGAMAGWKSALATGQAAVVQTICQPFLDHYDYLLEPLPVRKQVALPWRMGFDTLSYLAQRIANRARRSREHPGMIFGEESRIRAKMAEAILTRKI